MLIIDAHLDLAWNALQWNRDLLTSVYTLRTREANTPGKGRGQNTVALPEMRRGRIALAFGTLLARSTRNPIAHIDFDTPEQAYAVAQGQRAYYDALEQRGAIRVIMDLEMLNQHIAEWELWEHLPQGETPPVGIVITMESGDSILKPEDVGKWWAQGLRAIGPAHYGMGRYAGGTSVEDGFTPDGFSLLEHMQAAGMILDLTHLSDRAFWQALEVFHGTVIASHNNTRAIVPQQRQFGDAQIKAIATQDGVLGMAFDTWMMQPGWIKDAPTNPRVLLRHITEHIDHICQLTGSAQHVGIGSDLDGGFGREQSPADLDTIADLQRIPHLLSEQRNYSDEAIAAIMHGNWLRVLRRTWQP
jgi:membrane dipeptidase